MTDYQKLFADAIINDIDDLFCCYLDKHMESSMEEAVRIALESRIEAYDNERREQYIKALSDSLPRLVSEVI